MRFPAFFGFLLHRTLLLKTARRNKFALTGACLPGKGPKRAESPACRVQKKSGA
jgi:hypothetical protein